MKMMYCHWVNIQMTRHDIMISRYLIYHFFLSLGDLKSKNPIFKVSTKDWIVSNVNPTNDRRTYCIRLYCIVCMYKDEHQTIGINPVPRNNARSRCWPVSDGWFKVLRLDRLEQILHAASDCILDPEWPCRLKAVTWQDYDWGFLCTSRESGRGRLMLWASIEDFQWLVHDCRKIRNQ